MNNREYKCSRCGIIRTRDALTVKKVLFTEMGSPAQTFRARVVGWLCYNCLDTDADWNRPAHSVTASKS